MERTPCKKMVQEKDTCQGIKLLTHRS
jgi:hypothetical protein